MTQLQGRIVVGLDDSAGGRAALAEALRDAGRRGAVVDAIAVFQMPEYWAALYGAAPGPLGSVDQVAEATRERATEIVEEVRAAVADDLAAVPPVTVRAVGGSAAAALLDAARHADGLVVGSRGRGGFTSMLLGSVSLQCVLHAPCPVTVVHPAEETDPRPVG